MNGIVSYGVHVPAHRLARSSVATALGARAGRGARTVAGHDEDSTTMGASAARAALAASSAPAIERLAFATASPGYVDKTNATAVAAAAGLDPTTAAFDVGGAVRSGMAALHLAASATTGMAVLADVRTGLAGSSDESEAADAAVALVFGPDPIAEVIATAGVSAELMDRWREPGSVQSRRWEERFGLSVYPTLIEHVVTDVLKAAGCTMGEVDHVAITSSHARAAKAAARAFSGQQLVQDLLEDPGWTGTAHLGLVLAEALDRSSPGQLILVVQAADGADAVLLRTTDRIAGHPSTSVEDALSASTIDTTYAQYLTWRGLLRRDPPRRPDPRAYAPPAAFRRVGWKFAFEAQVGTDATRHLPPRPGPSAGIETVSLAGVPGTIATFTVDHLAATPAPPAMFAVVDFDGGGRYEIELTDCDPDALHIGARVVPTFRLGHVDRAGIRNYVWKAMPLRG